MRKLLFTLPFLLLAACEGQQQSDSNRVERVVSVGVVCVDTTSNMTRTVYVGTAEESRSIDMTFKYGGTIDKIGVKVGSKVRKGDLLASVSSSTLVNSQRTAQATLQQARDGYERLKMVHESGAHSTDYTAPEDVDAQCAKCFETAAKWAPVADEIWTRDFLTKHPGSVPYKNGIK